MADPKPPRGAQNPGYQHSQRRLYEKLFEEKLEKETSKVRRVEEDGIVIEGPEA